MANEYAVPPYAFQVAGNRQQSIRTATIASAATIAPTSRFFHVSGVAAIATITPPWDDFSGGLIVIVADGNFSFTTGGNILTAYSVSAANTVILLDYDPVAAKWTIISAFNPSGAPSGAAGASGLLSIRVRTTTANVNAGATLLPAVTGFKWRLVDFAMVSVGGAAATATTVDIKATQSASVVKLFAVPVASLVQTAVVKPGTIAASGPLADGAPFVQNDVSTAITIGSTTNNLSGSTNIDVVLVAALEP